MLAMATLLAGATALPSGAHALSIRTGPSWDSLLLGWSQSLQSDASSPSGSAARDVYVGWLRGLRTASVSVSAVPEPSGAALFGLGAALVAARTRRRRQPAAILARGARLG
jgi:hypothetical protein